VNALSAKQNNLRNAVTILNTPIMNQEARFCNLHRLFPENISPVVDGIKKVH